MTDRVNFFRPQAGPGIDEMMLHQHDQIRAQLDKLEEAHAKAQAARIQLDRLSKLGDLVSHDDVMDSASKIVSSGADPMQIATLLADMPQEGGPALQKWILQQDQSFSQKEAQLNQAMNAIRHETALAALRLLAAQHMVQQQEMPEPQAQEQNGLLSPTPQMSPAATPNPPSAGNPLMGDAFNG